MHDSEINKLDKIMANNFELQVLYEKDIVVKSWLNMVRAGKCTVEKALMGISITAIKEKHYYYQELTKLKVEGKEK